MKKFSKMMPVAAGIAAGAAIGFMISCCPKSVPRKMLCKARHLISDMENMLR